MKITAQCDDKTCPNRLWKKEVDKGENLKPACVSSLTWEEPKMAQASAQAASFFSIPHTKQISTWYQCYSRIVLRFSWFLFVFLCILFCNKKAQSTNPKKGFQIKKRPLSLYCIQGHLSKINLLGVTCVLKVKKKTRNQLTWKCDLEIWLSVYWFLQRPIKNKLPPLQIVPFSISDNLNVITDICG